MNFTIRKNSNYLVTNHFFKKVTALKGNKKRRRSQLSIPFLYPDKIYFRPKSKGTFFKQKDLKSEHFFINYTYTYIKKRERERKCAKQLRNRFVYEIF